MTTVLVRGKPVAAIASRREDDERLLSAAAWRGAEAAYVMARIARLTPLLARLDAWCEANPGHRLWPHRNGRAGAVSRAIVVHRNRLDDLATKVDELVRGLDQRRQAHVTEAYFNAFRAPAPVKRPEGSTFGGGK